MSIGDYELLRTLGQGGYAKVKLGKHKETGQLVAVKLMKKDVLINNSIMKMLKHEVDAMSQLDHPNILNLIHFSESE